MLPTKYCFWERGWHRGERTHPPLHVVMQVQFLDLAWDVGWLSFWFLSSLQEYFLQVFLFSSLCKNLQKIFFLSFLLFTSLSWGASHMVLGNKDPVTPNWVGLYLIYLKCMGSKILSHAFVWKYMQSDMIVGWLGKHELGRDWMGAQPAWKCNLTLNIFVDVYAKMAFKEVVCSGNLLFFHNSKSR